MNDLLKLHRQGPEFAEAALAEHRRMVDTGGDPMFLYHARYSFVEFYAYVMMMGEAPPDVETRFRLAISDMEKVEPPGPDLPIYAAHLTYRLLRDKDTALRLARQGLAKAMEEEANPLFPRLQSPPNRAMALRVELAILADTEPRGLWVNEILEELVGLHDVATLRDNDREKTTKNLLAAGVRTSAFKKLLLTDRKAFPRNREAKSNRL